MARKIPVLNRMLGAPALYAIAYGEIGSSLYYALGITAVYALSMTPIIFLVAGAIFVLAAASYAEGGATLADTGGASAFARRAFNDLVGFIAGWATVLDYVIAISLAALFIPHYITGAFGNVDRFTGHEATALAVGVVVVLTATRLLRRSDLYMEAVVVSMLDLVVQVGLAALGLALLWHWGALKHDVHLGVEPTWNSLAFSLPIAMVGFTGLEKLSGLAALAKDPVKTVPRALRSSVITVVVVYAAMATAATSAFPPSKDPSAPAGYSSELSTKWLDAPILGLASAVGAHFPHPVDVALRVLVGLTATLILLLAMATSFSGCARLTSAMGEHLQLPAVFARRSRRTLTPPAGLAGVGILSCAFLIVGAFFHGEEILTLASIYSFGILIALFLAQVSILWLRITEPEMPRPFMMRGNLKIGGKLVPVTAAVGAVTAFAAWIIALGTHPGARDVGVLWMAGGIAIYAVIRIRAGLPMLERVEPTAPPPEEWIATPSGPLVVPLERNDAIGEEMMATAMRLAVENNSPVVGVSAIMIPIREPIDAPRPEREREVEEVQRAAEELAAEYHVAYTPEVGRTRSPGRMIVDAAVKHDAALIVIGAPDKRRLAKSREEAVFGSTVDFVLRRAPCRVIVTHFPASTVGAEEAVTH